MPSFLEGLSLNIIYILCALVGLLVAAGSLILSYFAGDLLHHGDFGGHGDVGGDGGDAPFSVLSPTTISFFVGCFGGLGLASLHLLKVSPITSVILSLISSAAITGLVLTIMLKIYQSVQAGSIISKNSAIGKTAEVITSLPEGGVGEITYSLEGSRLTSPARSLNGEPISRGVVVEIVRIVGGTAYVKNSLPKEEEIGDSK